LIRFSEHLALEFVVVFAVFEFLLDPLTHENASVIRVDGQIAAIEEPVEVASHQQTVAEFVAFHKRVRLDVHRI